MLLTATPDPLSVSGFHYDPNWGYKKLLEQLEDKDVFDLQKLKVFHLDQIEFEPLDLSNLVLTDSEDEEPGLTDHNTKNLVNSPEGVKTPQQVDSPPIQYIPLDQSVKSYSDGIVVNDSKPVLDLPPRGTKSIPNSPVYPPNEKLVVDPPWKFFYDFNYDNDVNDDICHFYLMNIRRQISYELDADEEFLKERKMIDLRLVLRVFSLFKTSFNKSVYQTSTGEVIQFFEGGAKTFKSKDFFPGIIDEIFRNIGINVEKLLDRSRIYHPSIGALYKRDIKLDTEESVSIDEDLKGYVAAKYEDLKIGELFQDIWEEWCLGFKGQPPVWIIEKRRYEIHVSLSKIYKERDQSSIDCTTMGDFTFRCNDRFKIFQFIIYGMDRCGYRAQIMVDLLQAYTLFNGENAQWVLANLDSIVKHVFHVNSLDSLEIGTMFKYHEIDS